MCGIAGIKYKNGSGPLGKDLLEVMTGINHRGADSAGVGVYGNTAENNGIKIKVRFSDSRSGTGDIAEKLDGIGANIIKEEVLGDALLITISYGGNIAELADTVLSIAGAELQSVGKSLEISKAVGLVPELDKQFGIGRFMGTHGIGHVRLATESDIMVSTSHPFWSYGFSDVAVVHNGQLTNYHKLRRSLESKGWRFTTENDTELIAVYTAWRLSEGRSLLDSLNLSLEDFDGTYSYIVCTETEMGFAKDMLGAKPMVLAETPDMAIIASEEVGIQRVLNDPELVTTEPYPLKVATW